MKVRAEQWDQAPESFSPAKLIVTVELTKLPASQEMWVKQGSFARVEGTYGIGSPYKGARNTRKDRNLLTRLASYCARGRSPSGDPGLLTQQSFAKNPYMFTVVHRMLGSNH